MKTGISRYAAAVVAALCVATFASSLDAQYFGRNKVRYERFDFRIIETPHFEIFYYPAESTVTADAARMAERWWVRHARVLGHQAAKKPIIFYADHPDFQQTNVIGGFISQGTGGVTEGLRDRVIMPFTGVYADNDHVLGHELVHAFQYDLEHGPQAAKTRGPGIEALPLWLIEGMAEYLSLGRFDPNTAMWLRDAALRNDLPTIDQLTRDPRYFPYRYGQALWAYIGGKWGDPTVGQVYRTSLQKGWNAALKQHLGMSQDSLSKEWLAAIRTAYLPLMQGRAKPGEAGQIVLGQNRTSGDMNVSPTLSPDGSRVAFLARRDVFTIDLFIADSRTGEVTKQLTGPNVDSHFDALSFIQSSGTWSPDGRKLAFVVFADGDNELAIFDVGSGGVERRIKPREVGAIVDPAWSPDGSSIVFSGMQGGQADLYLLNLATQAVTRLTNDRYAELQPAWSPDGRQLAYATDRGPETDFTSLKFGPMRIAVMEVATKQSTVLPGFDNTRHITPQFAPNGTDLYFVADRDGFSDVYRTSLTGGDVRQVTRVATGVSGITRLSPALTVARSSGRMLFSVFNDAGYDIVGLDAAATQGTPVGPIEPGIAAAGVLPPAGALSTSAVETAITDATTGLPSPNTRYNEKPYHSSLSLDYLGAPFVGVGVSTGTFGGTGLAGAVAAYFGDMLGDKTLGASVVAQGEIKDIGGEVFYMDAGHRLQWLLGASHVPYTSGFADIRDTTVTLGGGVTVPARIFRQTLQRTFIDRPALTLQYPVSQTRRFELGGSYTFVNFDAESFESIALATGEVAERRQGLPSPPGLSYGQGSVAFVGDYSFFAFTSPAAGGRYRFEYAPIFGGLSLQTFLADYRRYFFKRPITFAMRGLYYGRFGKDAESGRLTPLYIGQETLIRGYSFENFNVSECTDTGNSNECPEFDRLVGSKIGVANVELRIPLLGTREFGIIPWGFLPIEVAPFFDAGVAMQKGVSTDFSFARRTTARVPVFSTGLSSRINLFGYGVLEAYYAYPFQRPDKGAHWGFAFAPGW
ncbi:MAG: BamA/TamA family outer membrane protein [Gemmatimonadaceae bacterium]